MFYLGRKAVPQFTEGPTFMEKYRPFAIKNRRSLGVISGKGDYLEDDFLNITKNAVLKQCSALIRPLLRTCNSDFFSIK